MASILGIDGLLAAIADHAVERDAERDRLLVLGAKL